MEYYDRLLQELETAVATASWAEVGDLLVRIAREPYGTRPVRKLLSGRKMPLPQLQSETLDALQSLINHKIELVFEVFRHAEPPCKLLSAIACPRILTSFLNTPELMDPQLNSLLRTLMGEAPQLYEMVYSMYHNPQNVCERVGLVSRVLAFSLRLPGRLGNRRKVAGYVARLSLSYDPLNSCKMLLEQTKPRLNNKHLLCALASDDSPAEKARMLLHRGFMGRINPRKAARNNAAARALAADQSGLLFLQILDAGFDPTLDLSPLFLLASVQIRTLASKLSVLYALRARNVDINFRTDGQTCLHYFAADKNQEMIELMLELGADCSALSSSGRTALECWYLSKVDQSSAPPELFRLTPPRLILSACEKDPALVQKINQDAVALGFVPIM